MRSHAVPGLPMCLACTPPRATACSKWRPGCSCCALAPPGPSLPCISAHCTLTRKCTPNEAPCRHPSLWLNDNPHSRLQADFGCPDDWSLLDLEADWLDYDEAPEERHWEEEAGEEGGSPEQQRSGSDSEGQGGPGTAAEGGPQAGLRVFRPRRPPPTQVHAAQLWGPACAFVCASVHARMFVLRAGLRLSISPKDCACGVRGARARQPTALPCRCLAAGRAGGHCLAVRGAACGERWPPLWKP